MSFLEIAERYDAFLCDLWGVIHDGDNLYPNVLESLGALHGMGKKVVFLSNAPRLAESIFTRMDKMGVKREWYLGGMTSGEAALKYMQSSEFGVQSSDKCYYLGQKKDEPLLDKIPQRRVLKLEDADFILCSHYENLQQDYTEIRPLVEKAASLKLPMLCINPDIEVIKLDGTRIYSAGHIAEKYKKLGGQVDYIGKPYPFVFELGMEMLGNPPKDKVLMIGDNVMTDIKGGKAFGIDTVFITQGILQNQKGDETPLEYCQAKGVIPTHIEESL